MSKQKTFGRSRPSIANELKFRRELESLIEEMQKDVQKELDAYLKQEVAQDASLRLWASVVKALRERWYKKFEMRGRILERWLTKHTMRRTDAQILRKLKQLGMTITPNFTQEEKELIRELSKENVSMIKSIPQQYLMSVQKAVSESFKAGLDSQQLYEHLEKVMEANDERVKNRARLITRDQMNKMTQRMFMASAKSIGATRGRWIHVPGKYSSRITHLHMDGKPFPLDEGLYDSDVGRKVKPGELIYCNCQMSILIPGFDE